MTAKCLKLSENVKRRATGRQATDLVGLLVSGHHAHGLDEGVSWIVHPGLDGLVQGPVVGGGFVPEVGVDGRGQRRGHAVVVLPQVREVSAVDGRTSRQSDSVAVTLLHVIIVCNAI